MTNLCFSMDRLYGGAALKSCLRVLHTIESGNLVTSELRHDLSHPFSTDSVEAIHGHKRE